MYQKLDTTADDLTIIAKLRKQDAEFCERMLSAIEHGTERCPTSVNRRPSCRVGCRRAVARRANNQARAMAAIAVGERKNAGALIVVRIVLFEWIRSRRLFGVSGAVRDDPKTLISRDAQCIAQYSRDSSAPPQNKWAGRYLSPHFAGAAYPRANLLLGDLQGLETPPPVAAVRQRKNPRSFFAQIYRRPRARPVQVARGGPARWRSWHRCWGLFLSSDARADGSSGGVSAGGEFLNCFGGQRLAADAPLATGYFGDLHPGHPPHVLAFDRDHGIGQFLNDLPLLLRVEHFFDQMDLYQWHCRAPLCRPRRSEVTGDSMHVAANQDFQKAMI
jgi:hypothetical protein